MHTEGQQATDKAQARDAAATAEEVAREIARRETMNIVIVGHVDHGKSTLVGRMLADTGTLPKGKMEAVKATCERTGKVFEYAFLLDALEAEQDQGITIDAARVFFRTERRDYIIIDAPGHIEFLKNMVTGAARAEAALLLIDASEGVRENSRRHGYLLAMLGIKQVVVAVNKMDLVNYERETFERIEREYREFLAEIGIEPRCFIPVSAREGDLIIAPSPAMPWFRGDPVLTTMDQFEKQPGHEDLPLRVPVQDVYKWGHRGDDRRIIAGRVASGRLSVGDEVLFLPSGKRSRVASVEGFNLPGVPTSVGAGRSTGVTLTEQLFVERGDIMSHVADAPTVATRIRVKLFWLGRAPMVPGRGYKLKLGTAETEVAIAKIHRVLDASDLDASTSKGQVDRHDVADLELSLRRPLAVDLAHENEITSRFVIVDAYDIAGGGIVAEVTSGPRQTDGRQDPAARRRELLGHPPTLLVLDLALADGEEDLAFEAAVEWRLLEAGHHAARASAHEQEIVHALLSAGLIVVTTSGRVEANRLIESVRDVRAARGVFVPADAASAGETRERVEQVLGVLEGLGRLRGA